LRTELARAAPGAGAILELRTVKRPLVSHRILLVSGNWHASSSAMSSTG
jgi:hypothetical protein